MSECGLDDERRMRLQTEMLPSYTTYVPHTPDSGNYRVAMVVMMRMLTSSFHTAPCGGYLRHVPGYLVALSH